MKPRVYLLFTLFWFAWIVALGLWFRNWEVGKLDAAKPISNWEYRQ